MKKSWGKIVLPVALVGAVGMASFMTMNDTDAKEKPANSQAEIKNVIFLIGDGMGTSYTSAYRQLMDDPATKAVEATAFDPHLVGMQATHPDDPDETITDSASAATAMSAGIKTYNNAVAVDNDESEVQTVLEAAKEKGKATGLVATSEITHATPASFGAHDPARKNMAAIADDYFDELVGEEHKVDVLLGGGTELFKRADRDLTEEFQGAGYSYVTDREAMLENDEDQVLGLFAPAGMPKMIDRDESVPSLREMTESAIERLDRDKDGFFLMVEGSQIDWAGHDNDIVGAMSEMRDFEEAFQAALDFAEKDKHTLVVATADHSTGGFSMGAGGVYNWNTEPLMAAKRTPDFMAAAIADGQDVDDVLEEYIDLELTEEEVASVQKAAEAGQVEDIDDAIEAIFDKYTNTGWTTGGHTGEDVPVYAFGPQKDKFQGQLDNTDHAKILFDLLKTDVKIQDR